MQINFAEFLHVDATIKTTKRQIELPPQIALPNDKLAKKISKNLQQRRQNVGLYKIYKKR